MIFLATGVISYMCPARRVNVGEPACFVSNLEVGDWGSTGCLKKMATLGLDLTWESEKINKKIQRFID